MTDLPTWEVVIRNGQPVWMVCGAGICVEASSGSEAMAKLQAIATSRGIQLPRHGPALPQRGPSEVDEPGV